MRDNQSCRNHDMLGTKVWPGIGNIVSVGGRISDVNGVGRTQTEDLTYRVTNDGRLSQATGSGTGSVIGAMLWDYFISQITDFAKPPPLHPPRAARRRGNCAPSSGEQVGDCRGKQVEDDGYAFQFLEKY
ncbi:hypothetical protein JQ615_38725 [Bradyrhizobium jicamae]|uniref:Uncharacterized protein n=1 Tax=Bradyrhizobium jicamae TaxID=280332 RepID=A0ABS5FWY1_9BRAD|nr:hypothetical protein [Bradyrhizobium jicamae]MBR0801298.1 hypothetical protein [Bradyrhizobium jicamae]